MCWCPTCQSNNGLALKSLCHDPYLQSTGLKAQGLKDKQLKIFQYHIAQVQRRNNEPADMKSEVPKTATGYNQQLLTTRNTRAPRTDSTGFRNSSENAAGLGEGAEPDGRCLRRY